MGRSNRVDAPGVWNHVVNRGAGGQPVFTSRADGNDFLGLLGEAHERFGVEIHAYCLMTNHYHLLVRCPEGGLSAFMQFVTSVYTRHANHRSDRDGPLFRGRFRSLLVDSEAYLLHSVRYIHRNPLDLGVAIDEYRWSSHRAYVGHRPPPVWLTTEAVLGRFSEGVAGFARFVAAASGDADPVHLRRRIELLLAEVDERLIAAPQGAVSTLLALAGPPPVTSANRAALRRARTRLAADPGVAELLSRIMRAA